MSELQNNPEPMNYTIERDLGDDLEPTEKHGWRVTHFSGDDKASDLGTFDTYTEAVQAINDKRGVDTDDLKADVLRPEDRSEDDGHGYGAYQANPNDPNYDRLMEEDGDSDTGKATDGKKKK